MKTKQARVVVASVAAFLIWAVAWTVAYFVTSNVEYVIAPYVIPAGLVPIGWVMWRVMQWIDRGAT